MNTKEILTIVALATLGLCLLCSLAKAAMKGDKGKKHCDKACGAFVFLAIVLLAVSQLLGDENEKYDQPCSCYSASNQKPTGQDNCDNNQDCNNPTGYCRSNSGWSTPCGGENEKYAATKNVNMACSQKQEASVAIQNFPGIRGDDTQNIPPVIQEAITLKNGCFSPIDMSKYNCSTLDADGGNCWILYDFIDPKTGKRGRATYKTGSTAPPHHGPKPHPPHHGPAPRPHKKHHKKHHHKKKGVWCDEWNTGNCMEQLNLEDCLHMADKDSDNNCTRQSQGWSDLECNMCNNGRNSDGSINKQILCGGCPPE